MAVLPTPGGSNDTWGAALNAWLEVAHNPDGTLISPGPAWINVTAETLPNGVPLAADPTGGSDCTSAIQTALNYIAGSTTAAVLYFPTGTYLQNGAVTWNDGSALMITGDGPSASVILLGGNASPNPSITYWSISSSARVSVWNMSFNNNVNSPSFGDTNIAIQFNNCNGSIGIENVVMQTGPGATNRINQCLFFNNCFAVTDIGMCDLRSYVNCVVMQGDTACVTIHGCSFSQNTGSGVSTAASVYMNGAVTAGDTGTGGAATLHMTNVILNSCDRGLLMSGGTGPNPAFVLLYDVEVNYPAICGFQFITGAQVWATACWITNTTGPSAVIFSSTFQGVAYFAQCTFQGAPGHTVVLGGGAGYGFSDCIFGEGGGSGGKATANTYDELNVQSSVSYVTVRGCHFNTDPYYGMGATPPRSAVYINSGAASIVVEGNVSKPNASYGTAALVYFGSPFANQVVNMPTATDE